MTSLSRIKRVIIILSGKGGVGKSSTTIQLALSLCLLSQSVSILDIDLTGPSIPRLLGVESATVRQSPAGWLPVEVHSANRDSSTGRLSAMSLGFLLASRGDAVVWRGPKKTAMVRQFLSDVAWEADTDFLLIDTPPGTGDEQIALVETLRGACTPGQLAGAVVVTTPQEVAMADVRKALSFCRVTDLKVLGLLENMSGFVCENCAECTHIFGGEGGRKMAEQWGVSFLGSVPVDPQFGVLVETGKVPSYPSGTVVGDRLGGVQQDSNNGGKQEDGLVNESSRLVEKYGRCLLAGVFSGIAKEIKQKAMSGGGTAVPLQKTAENSDA